MDVKGQIIKPAIDRFMDKVKICSENDCWLWTGATDNAFGYGKFRLNGKSINAHRASFILFNGEIPEGLFVCHKCDNPPCVNPEHLFVGTSEDNNKDRSNKGRTARLDGYLSPSAKLNVPIVLKIREMYENNTTVAKISKLLNISYRTVWDVCNRISWRNV